VQVDGKKASARQQFKLIARRKVRKKHWIDRFESNNISSRFLSSGRCERRERTAKNRPKSAIVSARVGRSVLTTKVDGMDISSVYVVLLLLLL